MSSNDSVAQRVSTLYADHHGWLYGWLRRKLGDDSDAADLAQDTFVRVMASQRLPACLGTEPRALLTHIAKGLVVDHWRRCAVERAYLEALANLPASEAPSEETRYLILENLCRIDAVLYGLSSRTREIFLLSQLDGMTYHQIADQLDIAFVTVKRHMRMAFAACLALD